MSAFSPVIVAASLSLGLIAYFLRHPGGLGIFYESEHPTRNALEKKWIVNNREKLDNASRDLIERVNFHDRDASCVIHSAHNRGVACGR